jgi:iron(II)-dependent oxidoreductase
VRFVQIHTPGSLLDGWDVDAAFDSFRVDHPDRWDGEGLSEVSGREDGSYPPFEAILHGYRDRMTDMLRARLVNGEAEIGPDGLVEPVETYLHTYGSALTLSPSPGLMLTFSSQQRSPVFPMRASFQHQLSRLCGWPAATVLHEHWHIEDWIQTRQTMGWKAPKPLPTDVEQRAVANAWGVAFELDRAALEADLIQ